MGCVSSKKCYSNVVCQCKERKRLLKLALERRCAFANAHCKYTLSLLAVAKAIKLLVAKLSTPSSTDLITYPSISESNEVTDNNTASHQQTPTETNLENSSSQLYNPTVPLSSSARGKERQEQEQKTQVDKNQDDVNDKKCKIEEEESEGVDEEDDDDDDVVCEHFDDGLAQPMPMPPFPREVQTGWDFFSPYDRLKAQMENGFAQSYDDIFLRMLRKEEGIPELEEVEERVMSEIKVENACVMGHNFSGVSGVIIGENGNGNATQEETTKVEVIKTPKNRSGVSAEKIGNDVNVTSGEIVDMKVIDTPTVGCGASDLKVEDDANVSECENKDLIVIDTATNGRELLDALKDIEVCFVRAYESGLDVSKMLEAKKFQLQTGLVGIKDAEGSSKIFRSIAKHRSTSSRSSSCMSIFSSSPRRSSSTWNEFKEVFGEDYAAMESGSHSLTLSKLYAWEKKLHDDVMAGEETRRLYDRKRIQLRNEDARADPSHGDKTRAEVRALHARISVSIRSAESISERIVKVKDEELYPQLVELLQGLMNTWKIMSELHESQSQIMVQVSSFNCPTYGKFSNKSHRLGTLELEAKVEEWRACFSEYVSSQKAYLEALDGWISMCFSSEVEDNRPPLLVIVHDWLACLEKLPKEAVTCAVKSFGKNIRALYAQQGKEQEQKRKVDGLAKEFDKKVSAFQKVENKVLGSKLSEEEVELDVQDRIEYLAGRKNSLEMFKNRLEEEKAKHFSGIQDTQRITLSGIQTGLSSVFESLVVFSKASVKMYADLVAYNEHAKGTDENSSNTAQGGGMEDCQQLN